MKTARDADDVASIVGYAPFFRALANPTRAQIIEFLLSGERCVCEMTGPLDQSQPLVSHHLALLREAGLVRMRNEGARTYYSIAWERFDGDLMGLLDCVDRLRSIPAIPNNAGDACSSNGGKPARRDAP